MWLQARRSRRSSPLRASPLSSQQAETLPRLRHIPSGGELGKGPLPRCQVPKSPNINILAPTCRRVYQVASVHKSPREAAHQVRTICSGCCTVGSVPHPRIPLFSGLSRLYLCRDTDRPARCTGHTPQASSIAEVSDDIFRGPQIVAGFGASANHTSYPSFRCVSPLAEESSPGLLFSLFRTGETRS